MNVTSFVTKDYGNFYLLRRRKNKPNFFLVPFSLWSVVYYWSRVFGLLLVFRLWSTLLSIPDFAHPQYDPRPTAPPRHPLFVFSTPHFVPPQYDPLSTIYQPRPTTPKYCQKPTQKAHFSPIFVRFLLTFTHFLPSFTKFYHVFTLFRYSNLPSSCQSGKPQTLSHKPNSSIPQIETAPTSTNVSLVSSSQSSPHTVC